jgi:hypothetical protein
MTLEPGGALFVPTATLARFRLWFDYEFASARRLVGAAQPEILPRVGATSLTASPSSASAGG